MHPIFSIQPEAHVMHLHRSSSAVLRRILLALLMTLPFAAHAAPQETFATPEEAVTALKSALKDDTHEPMLKLFGDEHKELFIQPDVAATRANRAKILSAMQVLSVLHELAPDRQELVQTCMAEAAVYQRAWSRTRDAEFLAELKAGNMEVDENPDIASFRARVEGFAELPLFSAPEVNVLLQEVLAAAREP